MSQTKTTKVIFLIEKVDGDVFAYFPEMVHNFNGYRPDNYTCYAHIGQHSACHPDYVRECSEAKEDQYKDLHRELIGQGYDDLQIISRYELEAILFLQSTNTTFTASFKDHDLYFPDDDECRDIFNCVLKNSSHRFRFTFGQSINDSDGRGSNPPTAYSVLASMQKYDCGTFSDFCNEFGYDTDSRKAYKIYKAVKREWENVRRLFTEEERERLQEISRRFSLRQ